jgi:hypothetical protein
MVIGFFIGFCIRLLGVPSAIPVPIPAGKYASFFSCASSNDQAVG